MKKSLLYVISAIAASSAFSFAFATGQESGGYSPVTVSEKFGFSATYSDGKVSMKWTPVIEKDGESFKYFKIVRSNTNSNPTYPEDGYIKYSSESDFSSYVDESPKVGVNWYRICAIYEKDRICSQVSKIYVTGQTEKKEEKVTKKEERKEPTENRQKTGIDSATKAKIDQLLSNYKTSLEAKFSSASDRTAHIDLVIKKAYSIKATSPKLKTAIRYLIEKLTEMRDGYDDSVDAIGGILKIE